MEQEVLHIKNMVCQRCIKVVKQLFDENKILIDKIRLGEVSLSRPITKQEKKKIATLLREEGFELITDKDAAIISAIKDEIILLIHHQKETDYRQNISDYLSQKLHINYSQLSKLFSETENQTIEKFVISQKIEKVKELLVYGKLTLKEIAYQLGYSSTAHLSAQFKRSTGFTPSKFKTLKNHKRKPLDKI